MAVSTGKADWSLCVRWKVSLPAIHFPGAISANTIASNFSAGSINVKAAAGPLLGVSQGNPGHQSLVDDGWNSRRFRCLLRGLGGPEKAGGEASEDKQDQQRDRPVGTSVRYFHGLASILC